MNLAPGGGSWGVKLVSLGPAGSRCLLSDVSWRPRPAWRRPFGGARLASGASGASGTPSGAGSRVPRQARSWRAARHLPRRSRAPRRRARSPEAPRHREHEGQPAWGSCSPPLAGHSLTGDSLLRPSGYVATPFLRMTHRGHSQTTLVYLLPGLPITIPPLDGENPPVPVSGICSLEELNSPGRQQPQ